jgi:phosphatidate cytidylyltransferase
MSASHAKRLATAAVLTAIVVAALFAGGPFIFAAVVTFSMLGLWEFYALFWPTGRFTFFRILGLAMGAALLAAAFGGRPHAALALLVAAFWLTGVGYTVAFAQAARNAGETPKAFSAAMVTVTGLIYVPGMLQFFVTMSPAETAMVLLTTFASDTGAYYAGNLIGGRKLWPAVSPKKTWAGSFGGLGAAVAACLLVGGVWGAASWWAWIVLGVLLSVAGQIGDLVESALKRSLDVKDSGCLLPGHGGILDRIDGLLLAAPVYALARTVHVFF